MWYNKAMKILDQLDDLNLDAAAKTQVAVLIHALLDQAQNEAKKYETDIQAKDLKIQALILELAHLRRIRYGVKNETLSGLQRDLFEETCTEDIAALMAEVEQVADSTDTKPKRPRAGRQPLPPHLPRIEHRHEPESCQCGQCGKDLVKIGEDITEQLDVEPAKFFVHRHIRPQYACRNCETITAAPIPPAIIDGGMAAVGLLVWVLISKYLDHLPLYRLEQIAARDQVMLSRSTMAEWVGHTGVALQPLVDRLTELLLKRGTLHVDESVPRRRAQKVKVLQCSYAAQEMRVGPSESPYRRRLQTTYCCYV